MDRKHEHGSLVDTKGAAPLVGVAAKTLENWRSLGVGPRHVKVGRLVHYRRSDIEEWLEANTRQSTSEPVSGSARGAAR